MRDYEKVYRRRQTLKEFGRIPSRRVTMSAQFLHWFGTSNDPYLIEMTYDDVDACEVWQVFVSEDSMVPLACKQLAQDVLENFMGIHTMREEKPKLTQDEPGVFRYNLSKDILSREHPFIPSRVPQTLR